MAVSSKLKRKAADFEQKKQYEKALETYLQILASARGTEEERDASLFNRIGDLHLRLGNVDDAVTFYDKAVDLYSEGGLLNNAIALCNKILRHSPGRNTVYHKLGIISAQKGFNSDAKKNFLEYADRMQRLGNMDEAFHALQEFADLCPGQDDIRLMLAEQLSRAERKDEALEQLQILYDSLQSQGRRSEAAAALERMRAINPDAQPRTVRSPSAKKQDGLVFLTLGDEPADNLSGIDLAFGDDMPEPPRVRGLETTSLIEAPLEQPAPEKTGESPPVEAPIETDETKIPVAPDEVAADSGPDAGIHFKESAIAGLKSALPEESAIHFKATKHPTPARLKKHVEKPLAEDRVAPKTPAGQHGEEFVDLGEWLREDSAPKSTRMISRDDKRVGEEQADFSDMLAKFKQGVAANVEEEDFDSHYDLGVAYREMGLLDEAIAEFQKALKGKSHRIRAYEAIGQAFIDKGEHSIACSVLSRAMTDPEMISSADADRAMIGINYLLGIASESIGKYQDAAGYYQRVMAEDIGFRDVRDRLASVSAMAK
jgi:tetratricopeptide (TPR) repeat protein